MRMGEVGEFGLIGRLREIVERTDTSVLVGIGDDAAVVTGGSPLLLTTDALVEGVHFRRDWISMRDVGYRALAASLSDIAAMGGKPLHAVVALAVPFAEEVDALEELYRGMAELCDAFSVLVVGGDVVSTPGPLLLSATVTGELLGPSPLRRSGANAGDWVFVTGDVGGAGAFVHYKEQGEPVVLVPEDLHMLQLRHARPQPQIQAAAVLAKLAEGREAGGCTSLNDISDGLASELHELAEASGVRLLISGDRIPTLPAVRHYARTMRMSPLDFALFGGEDFQLVGTVSDAAVGDLLAQMEAIGIRCTCIGRVHERSALAESLGTERSPVELQMQTGRVSLHKGGYDHFQGAQAEDRTRGPV